MGNIAVKTGDQSFDSNQTSQLLKIGTEPTACIFPDKNGKKKGLRNRNIKAGINLARFCCYNFFPQWVVSSVGRAADS